GNRETEHGFRTPSGRQQQQRLVHRADDQVQHPQRDRKRNQDQQAGDEIFAHGGSFSNGAPKTGAHGQSVLVEVLTDAFDAFADAPPDAADAVSDDPGCDSDLAPVAAADVPPWPPRKSVTYQPVPFN